MGDASNTAVLEPPDVDMPVPANNVPQRRRARRRPPPLPQAPAQVRAGPVVPGMNAPGPDADQVFFPRAPAPGGAPPGYNMRVGRQANDNDRVNAAVDRIISQIPRETADNTAGPFPDDAMDVDISNQELEDLEELLPYANIDEHRDAIQNRINSLIQHPRSTRARYPHLRIRRMLDRLQRGRGDGGAEMY